MGRRRPDLADFLHGVLEDARTLAEDLVGRPAPSSAQADSSARTDDDEIWDAEIVEDAEDAEDPEDLEDPEDAEDRAEIERLKATLAQLQERLAAMQAEQDLSP
jgi:hypothetical protein